MSIYASYSQLEQARSKRDEILFGPNQPIQAAKDQAIGVPIFQDRSQQSISNPLNTNFNGNANLHALYPNEFEYYACAFELLNSKGDTEIYLAFPIMPNNISETIVNINNIQKTIGGVVINNTPSFIPFDINLSGTFGRKFKFVSDLVDNVQGTDSMGTGYYMDSDLSTSSTNQVGVDDGGVFSANVKTGYGLTKILKKLYLASSKLDSYNKTRTLIFYNLTLNSNYVVEPRNLNLSQSNETNMMWQYNLTLKAIAPINTQTPAYQASLAKLTAADTVNKKINNSGKSIVKILQDQVVAGVFAALPDDKVNQTLQNILTQGQNIDKGDLSQMGKSIFQNTLNKNKLFM